MTASERAAPGWGNNMSCYGRLKGWYRQTFSSMLQLLLYLCSEKPDMPKIEHPQHCRRLSGGVRSPEAPRVWDGEILLDQVRQREKQEGKDAQHKVSMGV